jgi:signal peptidase I
MAASEALAGLDSLDYTLLVVAVAAAIFWGMALLQGHAPAHPLRARPRLVFLCAVLLFLLRALLLEPYIIPSASMDPTLAVGDRILVFKAAWGWPGAGTHFCWRRPQAGDLLVFSPPSYRREHWVKRCVALPGEVVACRHGQLWVDGQRRTFGPEHHNGPIPRPHRDPLCWVRGDRDDFAPITVPPQCYWVMGDNRDASIDSRFFGPLPLTALRGQPILRYAPARRVGFLP